MDSDRTEQRIVDLELRYMRVERTMQDLSDVLIAQQAKIDRLTAELAALRERVPEDQGDVVSNDPPPHY